MQLIAPALSALQEHQSTGATHIGMDYRKVLCAETVSVRDHHEMVQPLGRVDDRKPSTLPEKEFARGKNILD